MKRRQIQPADLTLVQTQAKKLFSRGIILARTVPYKGMFHCKIMSDDIEL